MKTTFLFTILFLGFNAAAAEIVLPNLTNADVCTSSDHMYTIKCVDAAGTPLFDVSYLQKDNSWGEDYSRVKDISLIALMKQAGFTYAGPLPMKDTRTLVFVRASATTK